MRFSYGLPVALAGAVATVALVQPYIAGAPTVPVPDEIKKIAKDITVLIDGQLPGSGVIIDKQGNTYTVLTAKHVVATEDQYEVVTPDNNRYKVNNSTIQPIDSVDLAVLQFTSNNKTYVSASLGNLTTEKPVYIAGFPQFVRRPNKDLVPLVTTSGYIILHQTLEKGYDLVYDNITSTGMSGGPVLNEKGKLVGIHGGAVNDRLSSEAGRAVKGGFNTGTSINTFLERARKRGLNFGSAAPVAQQPSSTPAPRPSPATAPPALSWRYQDVNTGIYDCLDLAHSIMQKDSLKNLNSNKEYLFVSGIAGSYAVDISCSSQYSARIVAGPDKKTVGLWLDRFWKAMAPNRVNLPPRPANAPASPATPPPALRWSFEDNNMSDDECVNKAYRIMQREGLRNITKKSESTKQFVSGFADNYAADISCNTEDWMVVVTGADKATAKRWRDKLLDGMKR
jgi:serine protease Do